MKKRITISGLANFMTASELKRRKIVRDYKYPNNDEPRAMRLYYREARSGILGSLSRGDRPGWLEEQARRLDLQVAAAMGRAKTRLRHNARGVRAWNKYFADVPWTSLGALRLDHMVGDVAIGAVPDLYVDENGQSRIVKLEFGTDAPTTEEIRIICQALLEGAIAHDLTSDPKAILYVDVPRGTAHRGARLRSRLRRDIEAACATISDIWEVI